MKTDKKTPLLDFLLCFGLGPVILILLNLQTMLLPWLQYLGLATGCFWTIFGPCLWWYNRKKSKAAGVPDIAGYLKEYSAEGYPVDTVKPVICPECGSENCRITLDPEEHVIQVSCEPNGHRRLLMDSEEYWDESNPQKLTCPDCGGESFNLSVGLAHRESGEVKWVYLGCRCLKCHAISSPDDWKIDYGPTDAMEANI